MKRYSNYILSVLFILVFIGCPSKSDDSIITPSQSKGSLSMTIDKVNAPTGVVLVSALLTREGFATISGTLNLVTDTTAELTLQSIPVGSWSLKVDAKNDSGIVLYSGQTDVSILPSLITSVNLTLQPTGNGTGSVLISVKWGTNPILNWTDYLNNPLISPRNNSYDNLGVAQPSVIFDGGKFKMWYTGVINSGGKYILYRESTDGFNWSNGGNSPSISPKPSSWDALAVHAGPVIKDDAIYRMYYCGYSSVSGQWHIGLAISSDGINWNRSQNPVLTATSGWEYQLIPKSVIKVNNQFFMFYSGRNYPMMKIGLAISNDGISWSKYSNNPILTPTQTWEGTGVFDPSVIYDNGLFYMVYAVPNSYGFGWATSVDGKSWTKNTNNPFFNRNQTSNNWGSSDISYPMLVKTNSEYRVYYSGYKSSSSGIYKIGVIRKPF